MLTAKMFAVQMKEFKFVFFANGIYFRLFCILQFIFIIVMIFNGITISKYKLINLLNSAKKNQKTRLKNPNIVGHSVFDYPLDSWNSISFNSKKPDACCGQ